jgi:DNA invertase Pin-like site-specific DNA recombinase
MKMRTAIYARVSTTDKGQDPDLQLKPLREYAHARNFSITGEYVDHMTGSKDRRPALDRLMNAARKRQIDCILVWKLDRFGRSLKHLVTAIEELNALGIGFVSYQENIDLTTPTGRLMFHIIGAMAEFERELIKERVRAGIVNAKSKGKQIGRKALAPIERRKIIEAHEGSPALSVRQLAKTIKQTPATVHKTLSLYRAGQCDKSGTLNAGALCL